MLAQATTFLLACAAWQCAGAALNGSAFPLPHTCEQGSPSFSLPFCDYTLPIDARVADLLSRLTLDQKVQQWNIGAGGFLFDPVLNIKVRDVH